MNGKLSLFPLPIQVWFHHLTSLFSANGKQLYAKYTSENHFIPLYMGYVILVSNTIFRYSDMAHRGHVPRKAFRDDTGSMPRHNPFQTKVCSHPDQTIPKVFQVIHNNLKSGSVFP